MKLKKIAKTLNQFHVFCHNFIVGFIDLFLSFELILVLIRLINEDTLAQCVAGAIDSEISTSYNPLKFQDEARQLCFSFGFYSNYTLLNKFLNNDLNFKQLNQAFNNKIAIRDERNVISQVIMCILFVSILKMILGCIHSRIKKSLFKSLVENLYEFILIGLVFGCKLLIFGQYTPDQLSMVNILNPGLIIEEDKFPYVQYFKNREFYLKSLVPTDGDLIQNFIDFNDLMIFSRFLNESFILYYFLFVLMCIAFCTSKWIQLLKFVLSKLFHLPESRIKFVA